MSVAVGTAIADRRRVVKVARSVQSTNAFEQINALIPPFMRELMGPSLASVMLFNGIVCVGYFHLTVMSSLVALSIALATMPAAEVETGFIDFILSRPIARHWIITRSIIVITVCAALLLVLMMLGTWAGLRALAPQDVTWPSAALIFSLAVNLGLSMANYKIGRKRRGVMWSNNVTEGNGRLVF